MIAPCEAKQFRQGTLCKIFHAQTDLRNNPLRGKIATCYKADLRCRHYQSHCEKTVTKVKYDDDGYCFRHGIESREFPGQVNPMAAHHNRLEHSTHVRHDHDQSKYRDGAGSRMKEFWWNTPRLSNPA